MYLAPVSQALMMMGTEQLSRFPEQLPSIDKTLDESSKNILLNIFARAYHAGRQSADWAVQRRDMNPDEVCIFSAKCCLPLLRQKKSKKFPPCGEKNILPPAKRNTLF